MVSQIKYDTNLAMGLGLIEETKILLQVWSPQLSAIELYKQVLDTGLISNVSAYRLKNIVVRCFANRFLEKNGVPAIYLKRLAYILTPSETAQLFFIYTCRTNPIFADFVKDVYWVNYESAVEIITKDKSEEFVRNAIENAKTSSRWAEGQIERMGRYLTGCCSDFGLLGRPTSKGRSILSFRIESKVVAYLAYDLHFAGVGDNALLSHEDWRLFGLNREDVLEEIKRLSLKGLLIIQVAGDVIRISWKFTSMETLCNVLTQS